MLFVFNKPVRWVWNLFFNQAHLQCLNLPKKGPKNLPPPKKKKKQSREKTVASWWLNQPVWKIWSSNWIISPSRGEKNNIFETTIQVVGCCIDTAMRLPGCTSCSHRRCYCMPAFFSKKWPYRNPGKSYSQQMAIGVYFITFSTHIWLVVSTPLKNITQIGSFFQVGVNKKNIWNHQLDIIYPLLFSKGENKIPRVGFLFWSSWLIFVFLLRLRSWCEIFRVPTKKGIVISFSNTWM